MGCSALSNAIKTAQRSIKGKIKKRPYRYV
jgi:hypothetical protein